MTQLTIACAIDLSDCSRRALRYAGALAGHFGAHLAVIHVHERQSLPAGQAEPSAADWRERLHRFVSGEVPHLTGRDTEHDIQLRHGHAAREILKFAALRQADLLVLGTHGQLGVQTSLFGSTMEHALRNSPVPVLAVPLGGPASSNVDAPLIQPGPVIAPVDFSPASLAASRIARGIASALGVPLLLMHVVAPAATLAPRELPNPDVDPDPALLMDGLTTSLGGIVQVESVIRHGSRGGEIAAVANERRVSVIVMSLKGEGAPLGIRKPGAIAYDVMRLAPVPVLALPPGASHAFAGHREPQASSAEV
jgi:nucleotide-binding universal stress UspA family protein